MISLSVFSLFNQDGPQVPAEKYIYCLFFTPGLCLVCNRYRKCLCGNKTRKIQGKSTLTQFAFEIPSALFDQVWIQFMLGGKHSEK